MTDDEVIDSVLLHEHQQIAKKLNFIDAVTQDLDEKVLRKAISLIDRLSMESDEGAKKIIITLSAILWSYKKSDWNGLRGFLIRVLSRIGYAPSSIMIDNQYDHKTSSYLGIDSYLDQLAITLNHFDCEVIVKDRVFLLTKYQKKIWSQIEQSRTLGISAPTSAGKSFIIALKAIDLILKSNGAIIYIVPTLSLVSQVSIDFRRLLDNFNLNHYEILNTYNGDDVNTNKIFVLTQEKAIGAFSQKDVPFKDVRLLVVDEIQNMERATDEDEQRAKTLYDLIIEFRHTPDIERIVISGPRIEGIGELCQNLFGGETTEASEKSSPVASFTYSIEKRKVKNRYKYFFNQHVDIKEMPSSLEFKPKADIPKPEGKVYTAPYHEFMSNFITCLGKDSKNIIFSPTAAQARSTAIALAEKLPETENAQLESLINYLEETVHNKYSLCEVLKKGVIYHHGRIPHHARRSLERAVSDKLISQVVCTTTLMQGVNLPAQNVIIRNPNLYIKEDENPPKLTQYEISNLRGRAGRLLKDFIGRTFVLDENAFEAANSNGTKVFEDQYKKIRSGYGSAFQEYKEIITEALVQNLAPIGANRESNFLLTYIRQMILRHGADAKKRFNSVGILLNDSLFDEVRAGLLNLTVPKEVCVRNRYWDPLDLEYLFLRRNDFDLPTTVSAFGNASQLQLVVERLATVMPIYSKRYFDVPFEHLQSTCINASEWMKEKPLKEILSSDYFDDAEKIEKTIERLQNKVSYGLPLLLMPLYDMRYPNSSFLRFIESGAYRPVTRRLLEYNIPRETAISLANNYVGDLDVDSKSFDFQLKRRLKEKYPLLSYWVQAQLEALLSAEQAISTAEN